MRKLSFLILVALFSLSSCVFNDHDISITYQDEEDKYSMDAYFRKSQTDKVDAYLDRTIGRHTKSSFRRSRINGVIALDDPGFFYIKKYPGHLRIKIDKEKNSEEAYQQLKSVREGIKNVLTN
jgi:hypothetical protein